MPQSPESEMRVIRTKHVMVVDDEPFILRSLMYILQREGFRVTGAEDGTEALAKIYASKPDVIFLDVMMPKLDGFELCHLIKQDAELRDIHVILFTAKGQAKDRQRAVEVGANEYIMKPFRPPLVIEKLRAIFGETLV